VIRRKPPRRRARDAKDDDYTHWLHHRPCIGLAWIGTHQCSGPIEQSHERNMTGLGRKEPPRRSVPMCRELHQAWEQHRPPFAGWTKELRRTWMDAAIETENAAYERVSVEPFPY
jgi:hypothetical protein